MAATFKVLSLLLSYPTGDVKGGTGDLSAVLDDENLLAPAPRKALQKLLDELADRDLIDLQERYVLLFDRTRSLSLHLFEHVHGEGRDRGQAMVDLMDLYERNGMHIEARELPDYLPLFLEFLASRPLDEARDLLGQTGHILAAVGKRLRKRGSPYAAAFWALESLVAQRPARADVDAILEEPEDDPDDLEALDRIWEDAPVTFGPGAISGGLAPGGDCPSARDLLARMENQGRSGEPRPTGGTPGKEGV